MAKAQEALLTRCELLDNPDLLVSLETEIKNYQHAKAQEELRKNRRK